MNFLKANKTCWNQRTEIHFKSKFYDMESFLNGSCSLNDIEVSELGNVENKSLLHLQCHFGMDTLSWARRGAKVTGVDFSDAAIDRANELKEKLNLILTRKVRIQKTARILMQRVFHGHIL